MSSRERQETAEPSNRRSQLLFALWVATPSWAQVSEASVADGAIELLVLTDLPRGTLHWGVAVRRKGDWTLPPPQLRPPSSRAAGDKARRFARALRAFRRSAG